MTTLQIALNQKKEWNYGETDLSGRKKVTSWVHRPYAYKLIRQLNEELKDKGFINIAGGQPPVFQRNGSTGPERKGTKCQSLLTKQEGTWYVMSGNRIDGEQTEVQAWLCHQTGGPGGAQFPDADSGDLDMTFESLMSFYTKDVKPWLKENTWLTKENIIQKKILPTLASGRLRDHH